METVTKKGRVLLYDELRGIMIISMLIYHICYDLAAVVGLPGMGWFYSPAADFWQLSICGVFIFIAGACCRYSKSNLKRGLRLFLLGMLFTVVTALFVPNLLIVFGLLRLDLWVVLSYSGLPIMFSRDGLAFRRSFLLHFRVHCIRQTFSVSSDSITAAFSLLTIFRCCHICFCSGQEASFPGFRFLTGLIVPDAKGLPFLAETVCGSTCSISRWFMGCCG